MNRKKLRAILRLYKIVGILILMFSFGGVFFVFWLSIKRLLDL